MRPARQVARASVRHGVIGLGVLNLLLPLVLLVRAFRALRTSRAARAARGVHLLPARKPTRRRAQLRTPGGAGHTTGDAGSAAQAHARGDQMVHLRSRRAAGRRPPSEMVVPMCAHDPACPAADAPDRDAARVVVTHPDQGWSLLCNGVVLFDDLGEILPDGGVRGTGRQQQVARLRRYGSRRRRAAAPSQSNSRAA